MHLQLCGMIKSAAFILKHESALLCSDAASVMCNTFTAEADIMQMIFSMIGPACGNELQ